MEPQGRMSDRSRSPQRKESPQRQKGKKTTAEVKAEWLANGKESRSWWIQTKTMRYHKTYLERLQTRSLQHQYHLSSQDQLPVQTVHPLVLLRPVQKEHRPALRMNPLTTVTLTEKENLAQQYKVHEVFTPEEQCSTQTFTF